MTPNGGILFALTAVAGAVMTGTLPGLAIVLALCAGFAVIEVKDRTGSALVWSAGIVAPLALFLIIVWVAIVGRSPDEIAAGANGTRIAALAHVTTICARLFLIAFVLQLVVLRFAHMTPLQFIRAVRAPVALKTLLALTLSWVDTILHAVDRSRTALVTAGVITPRLSARNIANGWLLIQTVWLSVVTIAMGRLRDKWPIENTLARLDETLAGPPQHLTWRDAVWISATIAALATAKTVR